MMAKYAVFSNLFFTFFFKNLIKTLSFVKSFAVFQVNSLKKRK